MKEDRQDTTNTKMKGLLKGLRYISQMFDNEKEVEIHIGCPTDVKHVAHIGWDGPSTVNKPSWMGEFKSPTGFSSVSPGSNVAIDDSSVKYDFEDPHKKPRAQNTSNSPKDGPDSMTKSTKRNTLPGNGSSTTDKLTSKEKHKSKRPSRNTSKDSLDGSKRRSKESSSCSASRDNSALDQTENVRADLPKKAPKRRSKDPSSTKGTRSSSRSKAETTGGTDANQSES